jgi:hypothetical protein
MQQLCTKIYKIVLGFTMINENIKILQSNKVCKDFYVVGFF